MDIVSDKKLQAQEAIELAYGLLWLVPVDRETKQGYLVSEARKTLLGQLDVDGKLRGLLAARTMIEALEKKFG